MGTRGSDVVGTTSSMVTSASSCPSPGLQYHKDRARATSYSKATTTSSSSSVSSSNSSSFAQRFFRRSLSTQPKEPTVSSSTVDTNVRGHRSSSSTTRRTNGIVSAASTNTITSNTTTTDPSWLDSSFASSSSCSSLSSLASNASTTRPPSAPSSAPSSRAFGRSNSRHFRGANQQTNGFKCSSSTCASRRSASAPPPPVSAPPPAGASTSEYEEDFASNALWKFAMRLSLQNDSRVLQYFSRSMLHMNSRKHMERHSEDHFRPRKMLLSKPFAKRDKDHHAAMAQVAACCEPNAAAPPPPAPSSCSSASSNSSGNGGNGGSRDSLSSNLSPMHHMLPPMPPLQFTSSIRSSKRSNDNSHGKRLPRLSSLKSYTNWQFPGLRPGFSIRVVRAEIVPPNSVRSVTEYVIHVVDLHTKVFWIVKKRFNELFLLRKRIRQLIRENSHDSETQQQLKFLLELPFPRRRVRHPSADVIAERIGELELFLRNLAALEPISALHVAILQEFQLQMCSSEFITSLAKIDTSEEPVEPKWLEFELFKNLNCLATVEGTTCYRFLGAFRNRCAVIESAVCPHCHAFANTSMALDALKDLRNVLTQIQQYVVDKFGSQYQSALSKCFDRASIDTMIEDAVFHAVEDTILMPLEQPLGFLLDVTINKELEARLNRNIELMRGKSQSEFGIPGHLQSEDDWGKSVHHLSMMDERPLAHEKINELLKSALEIFKLCGEKQLEWRQSEPQLQLPPRTHESKGRRYSCSDAPSSGSELGGISSCGDGGGDVDIPSSSSSSSSGGGLMGELASQPLSADDFLPIHLYVVVHAGLKSPLRTKEYLGAMIHPSKMLGEVGYFLTMFEVALQYLANM